MYRIGTFIFDQHFCFIKTISRPASLEILVLNHVRFRPIVTSLPSTLCFSTKASVGGWSATSSVVKVSDWMYSFQSLKTLAISSEATYQVLIRSSILKSAFLRWV